MMYICIPCGYLYVEHQGDSKPEWSQLPKNWLCPDCGTDKRDFAVLDLEVSEHDD